MDLELSSVARIVRQGRRRSIWTLLAVVGRLKPLGPTWDRLFAASPAAWMRRIKAWRVSTVLYLASVALVGGITIGIFFGVGFYSLARQTAGTAAVSPARHDEVTTPTPEIPETPPSAGIAKDAPIVAPVGPAPPAPDRVETPVVKRWERASSETVSGEVTEVPDAMTWIVADRSVQLWGIRPGAQGSAPVLLKFVDWVRTRGPVVCQKHVHSSRYQCLTASGEDIAEAALLDGVGRAAEGATLGYRDAEAQARKKGKGVWAKL